MRYPIEQEYPTAGGFRKRRAQRRRAQLGPSANNHYDFEESGEAYGEVYDEEFGWLPNLNGIKNALSWIPNPFGGKPAAGAPPAPGVPRTAPPANPSPATSTAPFLKDRPELQKVTLGPRYPLAIVASWPSKRRALAGTYNRVGGLIQELASQIGIDVRPVLAVWQVESGGRAHTPNQAIIRFENHKLYELWGKGSPSTYDQYFRHGGRNSHPGKVFENHQFRENTSQPFRNLHTGSQQDEYSVLNLATRLAGKEIAVQCISIGGPQVLGSNYKYLGYTSASAMYDAWQASERAHVLGFFDFCRNYPAPKPGDFTQYIKDKNWAQFSRYYNGTLQIPTYTAWFTESYNEALQLAIPSSTQELEDEYGNEVEYEYEYEYEHDYEWETVDPAAPAADSFPPDVGDALDPALIEEPGIEEPADEPTQTADGHTVTISRVVLRDLMKRIARLKKRALVPRNVQRKPEAAARKKIKQLARNSRRVGSVRNRKNGRRYPVFQGRTSKGKYNMVARPRPGGQNEILMITPSEW